MSRICPHHRYENEVQENDQTLSVYVLRAFHFLGAAGRMRRIKWERHAAAFRSTDALGAEHIVDEPVSERKVKTALRFGV